MNRRRIIWYSGLVVLAGGLLGWQWWTEWRVNRQLANALARINDADPAVRGQAAEQLAEFGRESDKAWNELATRSLYETDDDARDKAIKALKELCQSNVPKDDPKRIERKRRVLQVVLDGFKIGDVEIRRRVPGVVYEVAGLQYHERAARRETDDVVDKEVRPVAVTALVAALKDPDEDVRDEAVLTLRELDKIPAEAEPGLLVQLGARDAVTRDRAAKAMVQLERISDAAIPGLVVAVQDDIPNVRLMAFQCLVRIGPKAAPEIRGALAKAPEKTRGYLEICLKALDVPKDG
jgi:HEAT repeat protein